MTDNRQTATKVKGKRGRRKREESTFYKTVLEKASESFAVVARSHYHTKLYHIGQEKHDYQQIYIWIPMTTGLPDLLCKHWFTSSVWNFWGPDVPPGERP